MELVLRTPLLLYSLAVAGFSNPVVGQQLAQDGSQMIQFNVSYGDLMLTPDLGGASKVLIYYSNGLDTPGWGEICADNIVPPESSVATVICRQYGRKDGQFVSLARDEDMLESSRVWLYNVSCGEELQSPYHILRCQHNVSYGSNKCTHSVGVLCSNEYLADSGSRYQGQVYLCPPNGFHSLNRSVSTGLVLLYLHDSWRTINLRAQMDSSDLHSSLCRQLGFTGAVPNSGISKRASQYSFDYCYDSSSASPHPHAEPYAWLTTDQVDCRGSPRACSGCCYDYPQQQCRSNDLCNMDDDLVISCTFDSVKKVQPMEGDPDLCTFKMENLGTALDSSVCAHQEEEIPLRTFEIVVGVLGPFALLGVVLSVCGVVCCCCWWYRRRHDPERRPLNGPPPPPPPPPPHDDDPGN